MDKIYLDSCLVIYLVERHPRFHGPLRARLAEATDATFCVSALTRLEVLTRPLREHDDPLVRRYESFLGVQEQLALDDDIVNAALNWRVSGLKTPDALHVALAKRYACTAFWTNDDRLAKAAPGWSENALKDVGP
jgi:predicted nucleic acid-binding protein